MRVSTGSRLRGREFSRRSCRESGPRPFYQKSGALPLSYSQPPIQIESVGRFVFIPILEVALVHLRPRKTLCVQPFSCTYMNTRVSLHSTDQQTCHVFRSALLPSSATNPCLLSQCLSGLQIVYSEYTCAGGRLCVRVCARNSPSGLLY